MKNTFKSIGAVIAGLVVVAGLSIATDSVLEHIGVISSAVTTGMLAFALMYRIAYTILGGYVTASLAPGNKMRHVWILAGIGQVGGIAGVVFGWNLSAHWYPIAIAVTAIPSVLLGGWLRTRTNR